MPHVTSDAARAHLVPRAVVILVVTPTHNCSVLLVPPNWRWCILGDMTQLAKYIKRDTSGDSYRLVERTLKLPVLVLGVIFVPILIGTFFLNVSSEAKQALEIAGWAIWVAFAVEYVWLLYLAPDRRRMIGSHKLDLAVILIPFLRPLRFLRVVRMATAATGLGRAIVTLRRIGGRPGFQPFFATVSGVLVVSAGLALAFEHEQPGSTLTNFGDALWWSIVTSTTVGYGDHFPVTPAGQVVAVVLMMVGIAGLSVLTASIAALFVTDDEDSDLVQLRVQLDRIEALLVERGQA